MGRKICLRCKGKTLQGIINKILKTKSLFCLITSNKLSRQQSEFLLKVKAMGLNQGYLLKSFLRYTYLPKFLHLGQRFFEGMNCGQLYTFLTFLLLLLHKHFCFYPHVLPSWLWMGPKDPWFCPCKFQSRTLWCGTQGFPPYFDYRLFFMRLI